MKNLLKPVLLFAVAICTLVMTSCKEDIPKQYSVDVICEGNGTAIADPAKAEQGVAITLTATPAEGHLFKEWSVAGGSVTISNATANPATFVMPAEDVVIEAVFVVVPATVKYSITVTGDGNGEASASVATAAEGEEVTLTATPAEGYDFGRWEVVRGSAELDDETVNPVTFVMPAEDVEIKAEFVAVPPKVKYTVTVTSDGNGEASASAATAAEGEKVTLTATPAGGYGLSRWVIVKGSVELGSEVANPVTFVMPAEDVEIKAEFTDDLFSLIPDAAFKRYCQQLFDTDKNGHLSQQEAEAVKTIIINNAGVKSLAGVELFVNLIELACNNNSISDLDISNNPLLLRLDCNYNNLSALDVSNNPKLELLYCDSNSISDLDLSNNHELELFMCAENNLSSLDVSNNAKLLELVCKGNGLSSLDVSNNTALKFLSCDRNNLSSLNLGNNSELEAMDCQQNNLSSLDVSGVTGLHFLICNSNNLSSLDVSNNEELTLLYCYQNNLTSLNIDGATALMELNCAVNSLSSLDVSGNPALGILSCYDNDLSSLNVSGNPMLRNLWCYDNNLSDLDISDNTALVTLWFNNNDMSADVIRTIFSELPARAVEDGAVVNYGGTNPGTAEITAADKKVAEDKNWRLL